MENKNLKEDMLNLIESYKDKDEVVKGVEENIENKDTVINVNEEVERLSKNIILSQGEEIDKLKSIINNNEKYKIIVENHINKQANSNINKNMEGGNKFIYKGTDGKEKFKFSHNKEQSIEQKRNELNEYLKFKNKK